MNPVLAGAAVRAARRLPLGKALTALAVAAVLAGLAAVTALHTLVAATDTDGVPDRAAGSCATLDTPGGAADGIGTRGDGTGYGNRLLTPAAGVDALDDVNTATATAIVTVGTALGVPPRGHVIAVATALQESRLDWRLSEAESDRDSAGAFQQRRPWGPDRVTAEGSARLFYTGGAGGQRGLLDVPGWQDMALSRAAQAVQVSAFPDAYGRWERLATDIVAALSGGAPSDGLPPNWTQVDTACDAETPPAGFVALPGADDGEQAVNAAARWLGTPYAWGGGTPTGPSPSIRPGESQVGFDCSGLVLHAWYQATDGAINLPHSSRAIATLGVRVTPEQARAGDVLSFASPGGTGPITHDGLYDGRGGMIHAPSTGKVVHVVPGVFEHSYYGPRLVAITRPTLGGQA